MALRMEVSYQGIEVSRYQGPKRSSETVFRDYDEKGREWPNGFSALLFENHRNNIQKNGLDPVRYILVTDEDKTLPKVDCGQRVAVGVVHQNAECTPHR